MSGPKTEPIEPVYAEIGKRVRRARTKLGLTQKSLSEVIDLSRTSIANIERGEQRFMVHSLFELAAALHVPVFRLLPGEPQTPVSRVRALLDEVDDPEAKAWIATALVSDAGAPN